MSNSQLPNRGERRWLRLSGMKAALRKAEECAHFRFVRVQKEGLVVHLTTEECFWVPRYIGLSFVKARPSSSSAYQFSLLLPGSLAEQRLETGVSRR